MPQVPRPDIFRGDLGASVRTAAALVAAMAGLAGCATQADGSRWGEHASFRVGWERTGDAAMQAVRSPWVWAPLAGAAAVQVDNLDHRISHWAVDHTPVFGSVKNAGNASDILEVTAGLGYAASVLATPGGASGPDWWSAKLNGGMVGLGAMLATGAVTEGIKVAVDRERPNGDSYSFPSGHTAFAAVSDTMTVRNLHSIPMSDGARTAFVVAADAVTFATGWARVEAAAHYPSDVLVGMAIGNFFGQTFDSAFLGEDLSQRLTLSFEPARHGGTFVWNWRF